MLAIHNIGSIVTAVRGPVRVDDADAVRVYHNASLGIDAGRIAWVRADAPRGGGGDDEVIDAEGGCVIPGLIDCHTHAVFAGTREQEFVQRIGGASYLEIAESGGGIQSTVSAVRRSSVEQLVESARARLDRMLACGVTTVEIKSGYGLSVEDELKMLRAIKLLGARQPIEISATYLAAHTVPTEYAGRGDDYLAMVTADEVLRTIADQNLAVQADVFCEQSACTVDQSRRYLAACSRYGLRSRVHADQITQMGASRLAAEVGAVSADHLEMVDDASLEAMRAAGTIGVLLPGCSMFLGVDQAPARRIIDAGVPVALATDCNPGSSMIESLPLVMSIACTQMHMTPAEALAAATANAAAVLERQDRVGVITDGMQADLVILDVPRVERMLYEFGRNCVRTVIKRGRIVYQRAEWKGLETRGGWAH